ncbi:MAG: Mur ligase family protein [Planctomycetaceae bacterium]
MMPDPAISRTKPPDLTRSGQQCLLLGAKGSGMTALADILLDLGQQVTGLDHGVCSAAPVPFGTVPQMQLLPWNDTNDAEVTQRSFDVCIASPAVAAQPLVSRIRLSGIPVLSLHECLAHVFSNCRQLCVAGTHGKSTTSAMLAWILHVTGRNPGFFVGAHQPALECSGRAIRSSRIRCHEPSGDDTWCVLESCEFSRSFHHFRPQIVALTGIERDHFDCFPDQASEDSAFQQFLQQLPKDGVVVLNADCQRSRRVATAADRRQVLFRISDDNLFTADDATCWTADQISIRSGATTFRLHAPQGDRDTVLNASLTVPGRHNVCNAVAAIVAAGEVGVDVEESCRALATFSGIRRRFERRGHHHGITLIDDYAHHPSAIRTTLLTARAVYPGRRILVAFEPHQLVRTEALFSEFVNSLQLADEVLLLPVLPARENVTHRVCCRTSGRMVKELNRLGTKAFLFANLDQIVSRLDHSGRPTDIFITMGAGRTNAIHDQLIERLRRDSVA